MDDAITSDLDLEGREIEKFVNMINSTHNSVQQDGTICLGRIISTNNTLLIQKIFESGVVPKLLELMTWDHETELQTSSSWCIANICAGEDKFSESIIELGGLDIIFNLFDSKESVIVSNAAWGLANIAGNSVDSADLCLKKGFMERLLNSLFTWGLQEILIHAISNLCRGGDFEQILPALPVLRQTVSKRVSQEAVYYALWGICYISKEKQQEVIDSGCVKCLVEFLQENNTPRNLFPTLRTLGRLLVVSDDQADAILSFPQVLPRLFELTIIDDRPCRKDAFWIISNIALGTRHQVKMIFENKTYIERLKTAVATEKLSVADEAAHAILNLFDDSSFETIQIAIHEYDILKTFTHLLTRFDQDLKKEALKTIRFELLSKGVQSDEARDAMIKKIQGTGLLDIIKDLAKDSDLNQDAEAIMEFFNYQEKSKNS